MINIKTAVAAIANVFVGKNHLENTKETSIVNAAVIAGINR